MADTEGDQHCCGLPVTEDGYCQHRGHHKRQATPELLDATARAAYRVWHGSSAAPFDHPGMDDTRARWLAVAAAVLEAAS